MYFHLLLCLVQAEPLVSALEEQRSFSARYEGPFQRWAGLVSVRAVPGKAAAGAQRINVTLSIPKGWFVYAAMPGDEDWVGLQTIITVESKTKLEKVRIDYPPGTEVQDRVVGNWRKYEGKVVVPVTVRRARGDRQPVTLKVKFSPRNGRNCGLPVTKTVTVPFSSSQSVSRSLARAVFPFVRLSLAGFP